MTQQRIDLFGELGTSAGSPLQPEEDLVNDHEMPTHRVKKSA
jgi:hypothetical protein